MRNPPPTTAPPTPVTVNDLHPDPSNRRAHNARNLNMVVAALQHVGAARSIVIDEDNVVLAGNGVREAANRAGLKNVLVVETDGTTVVAVRRRGLTPEQKRALALYDNRSAELAEWNVEQLRADRIAGLPLAPFWSPWEMTQILGATDEVTGLTDPDAVPPARPTTTIRRGDLFTLGAHRLLCGDATDAPEVQRLLGVAPPPGLMVTDPPYGVEYDATWRAKAGVNKNPKKQGVVANDDRVDWSPALALFPGDVAYVWHAGLHGSTVAAGLTAIGFEVRNEIIWAKDRLAMSRGDYHWQHEPCWYAVRKGRPGHRTDDRSQSTVWNIPARDDSGHGHPTQKPVECMARPMRNHDPMPVYDPFCGSGTTIIAAERLKRACLAMELNPICCQIIVDRWEAFTGMNAEKEAAPSVRAPRRRATKRR